MNNLKERLSSRKLWVTVVGVIFFALQGDYDSLGNLIMVYLGAQGISDAARNYNPPKQGADQ